MNKIFTQVEEKLSVIIYVVMLAITFANVIGRYYFRASISATDEITTNIFVLLSVIGTGIAAKSRSHLGLSVLTELMPRCPPTRSFTPSCTPTIRCAAPWTWTTPST